jgi:hypothetical protein
MHHVGVDGAYRTPSMNSPFKQLVVSREIPGRITVSSSNSPSASSEVRKTPMHVTLTVSVAALPLDAAGRGRPATAE